MKAPCALFVAEDGSHLLSFTEPEQVLEARDPGEVRGLLAAADKALASGRFVAGAFAYEAGAAFGLTMWPQAADGPPLAWLGVFGPPEQVPLPELSPSPEPVVWRASLDAAAHAAAVRRIHGYLAAGDTYQVNFTFPLEAASPPDPWSLFTRLLAVQRAPHGAFLDLGRFAIASASPELFFARVGDRLRVRPMKGTAPRGIDLEDDARAGAALQSSEKDRAENLMIVDMLRNDLGRVAETGSVAVPALFEIERYPTLLQMTSSVTAVSRAPFSEVMRALFPCASVTGAPKIRTMEIIAELEREPRGFYTGTLGWAGPDAASWNVAIRTAVLDKTRNVARYGVGSGIVADSKPVEEYAECLLKARILEEEPFALLETLAFTPGRGYRRLEGHLARLEKSARYFGVPIDKAAPALDDLAKRLDHPSRVRLLVDLFGRATTESQPLVESSRVPLRVALAGTPVSSGSAWLRHKTTRREAYDEALCARPDCDDVLLFNERGELTESCLSNVAVETTAGRFLTPPLACGLLPGVERGALLAQGRLEEGVVRARDLGAGQRLWLFNSVRGLREAVIVG